MFNRILNFLPFAAWLIISTILLTLPGSSLPKEDWLDKIWFDKWVHIGMFGIMVVLGCRGAIKNRMRHTVILFTGFLFFAVVYGTVMEFVQKYWVINRSFDIADIAADTVGALIGWILSRRWWLKK